MEENQNGQEQTNSAPQQPTIEDSIRDLEQRVKELESKPEPAASGPTSEEWEAFKKKLDAAGIR